MLTGSYSKYLSHALGKTEYYDAVEHIMQVIDQADVKDSAYPTRWSHQTGKPTNGTFLSHNRQASLLSDLWML